MLIISRQLRKKWNVLLFFKLNVIQRYLAEVMLMSMCTVNFHLFIITFLIIFSIKHIVFL